MALLPTFSQTYGLQLNRSEISTVIERVAREGRTTPDELTRRVQQHLRIQFEGHKTETQRTVISRVPDASIRIERRQPAGAQETTRTVTGTRQVGTRMVRDRPEEQTVVTRMPEPRMTIARHSGEMSRTRITRDAGVRVEKPRPEDQRTVITRLPDAEATIERRRRRREWQ
jgi:hypothetical protein